MTQLHWPIIHRHPPPNALNHAANLEADFEALDASVKLSTSKHHRLPSSLRDDIVRGIFKAFSDSEYPYELSKEDEKLIGALMLKHITIEATERARDRIPLRQYHDLRRSFQELVPKLSLDGSLPDPNSLTKTNERGASNFVEPAPIEPLHDIRDSISRASEAAQPAVKNNGDNTHEGADQGDFFRNNQVSPEIGEVTIRLKKKGRKRKDRDRLQTKEKDRASIAGDHNGTLELMGNPHGVAEAEVHKDGAHREVETDDTDGREELLRMFEDTEARCENIRLQVQDFESGQVEESTLLDAADELMEDQGMVGTHVVTENNADTELVEGNTLVNDSSDQAQLLYDNVAKQTRGHPSEHIQHAQKATEEVTGLDASSLITFNIEHQAAVNRLYVMNSVGILQNVSSSLEAMRSSGHDAPHSIHFTNAVLLEDGNVEVHAHADSKEDMERLSRIRGWDLEFEKSISVPAKSYAIELTEVNFINIRTRKHKAAAIGELLGENSGFATSLRGVDDIRDIRWCKEPKEHTIKSNLIIEFRTAQQANEALDIGVFVRGKHYTCQSVERKFLRCGKCQAFDHHKGSCSSAPRCGKCASQHVTSACTSDIRQCANCNGQHQTSDKRCPAVKAYKQTLRYTDHSAPVKEIEHQEPALNPQSQTANLTLPSSNPMPVAPHNESQIKVETNESLSNLGSVRQHQQGGAAAARHPSMPVNARNEQHVRTEGSEPTQEMDLARNNPPGTPDLILLRRELEDLRTLVGQFSGLQHQPQQRKRGADQMLTNGPPSHAMKKPRLGTQGRYSDPNRSRVLADRGIPIHAVAPSGPRLHRQGYTRGL